MSRATFAKYAQLWAMTRDTQRKEPPEHGYRSKPIRRPESRNRYRLARRVLAITGLPEALLGYFHPEHRGLCYLLSVAAGYGAVHGVPAGLYQRARRPAGLYALADYYGHRPGAQFGRLFG